MEVTFGKLTLRPQRWQLAALLVISLVLMGWGNQLMHTIGIVVGVLTTTVVFRAVVVHLLEAENEKMRAMWFLMNCAMHGSAAIVALVMYVIEETERDWAMGWFVLGVGVLNGILALMNFLLLFYYFLFAPEKLEAQNSQEDP